VPERPVVLFSRSSSLFARSSNRYEATTIPNPLPADGRDETAGVDLAAPAGDALAPPLDRDAAAEGEGVVLEKAVRDVAAPLAPPVEGVEPEGASAVRWPATVPAGAVAPLDVALAVAPPVVVTPGPAVEVGADPEAAAESGVVVPAGPAGEAGCATELALAVACSPAAFFCDADRHQMNPPAATTSTMTVVMIAGNGDPDFGDHSSSAALVSSSFSLNLGGNHVPAAGGDSWLPGVTSRSSSRVFESLMNPLARVQSGTSDVRSAGARGV
jgi:hypothetical protein